MFYESTYVMLITAEAEEGSWPQLTRERNPELESSAHLSFLGSDRAKPADASGWREEASKARKSPVAQVSS